MFCNSLLISLSSLVNSPMTALSNPLQLLSGGTAQRTGGSNLASLIGAGLNISSALNAQKPQSPSAAQQGASPWSPYAKQAAADLNALNNNPNLVYGLPGYQFQQQQGAQGVNRSAAAAGGGLSGGTLAALNQQAQSTAAGMAVPGQYGAATLGTLGTLQLGTVQMTSGTLNVGTINAGTFTPNGGNIGTGRVDSHGDHRIAMSFSIAGLCASGPITIDDCANVNTSFKEFKDLATHLGLQLSVI